MDYIHDVSTKPSQKRQGFINSTGACSACFIQLPIFHILLMLLFSADTRERGQHTAQANFIGLLKIRVNHKCYWFICQGECTRSKDKKTSLSKQKNKIQKDLRLFFFSALQVFVALFAESVLPHHRRTIRTHTGNEHYCLLKLNIIFHLRKDSIWPLRCLFIHCRYALRTDDIWIIQLT